MIENQKLSYKLAQATEYHDIHDLVKQANKLLRPSRILVSVVLEGKEVVGVFFKNSGQKLSIKEYAALLKNIGL